MHSILAVKHATVFSPPGFTQCNEGGSQHDEDCSKFAVVLKATTYLGVLRIIAWGPP